jgi:arylsulfatase A-like enzyme
VLTRRQFIPTVAAPLLAQQRKPNIVLIVSDDHHWQCLGAAGNPHIHTPHLDKLAARGVLFTNGVVSTSQCAPSRGILLSGLETYQTGLDSNGHIAYRTFRGATVVEQLKQAGYETNLVGKWHIEPSPKECGFTKAPIWLRGGGSPYINPKLRHGLDAATDQETPGHITGIFTDSAIDVVRKAQQPYLLWLTYNAPHTPWTASEQYRKLYAGRNASIAPPAHPKAPEPSDNTKYKALAGGRADRAYDWETYYSVITEMDAHIGRLVQSIEQSGQWDNTLILFLGDNGYLCGSKGLQGKVHPWEESVRIPFLAAGGLVKASPKSDAPVASIDVPATILDYAGVRSSHKLAGTTMRGAFTGGKFPRDAAFVSWNDGRPEGLAIREAVEPYRLVRTPAWKYIVWESRKEALFDLHADPSEEKNLTTPEHSATRKKMKDRLRTRMKETSDPAIVWL